MAIIQPSFESTGEAEAIIVAAGRPALLIREGRFEEPVLSPWKERLEQARPLLEQVIPAVCRVQSSDPTVPYIGSGFLVEETLVMTARQIAGTFVEGVGDRGLKMSAHPKITANFLAEVESDKALLCKVLDVQFIHPFFDVAVLKIEPPPAHITPLILVTGEVPINSPIAAIGYPSFDSRNPSDTMMKIFGEIFGVKRLMPGFTLGMNKTRSFKNEIPALSHDATTLGGTGGAPIVDLNTGHVVGIQFAGQYLVANYAIPAWELARDPRVRKSGVMFTESLDPPWMDLWESAEAETGFDPWELAAETVSERFEENKEFKFFEYDKVRKIFNLLVKLGMATDSMLRTLFNMMPPEFIASLTPGDTASATLYSRLTDINRFGLIFSGHSPLYIVLSTAIDLNPLRRETTKLKELLGEVIKIEQTLATKAK